MSERPDPEVLDCYPFDMGKLPVGTKFTDSNGVMRVVRQHFTDPAGHYTWATQPKRTSRGVRYDRDGRAISGNKSSIVLPETVELPGKVDGQEIDLTWLPVGTRFRNSRNVVVQEIREVSRDTSVAYPITTTVGAAYTRTGRFYQHKADNARRSKEDIVIASIVLPRRARMPRAGEFDALMAAHSTAPAPEPVSRPTFSPSAAVPIPAPAPTPTPQPQPEAEPSKPDLNNIDLNSWEW